MQILKNYSKVEPKKSDDSGNTETSRNLIKYFILTLVVIISSFPWSLRGMNWSDFTFIFHYANKLVHGYFPYKDYVFNTGILPILLDYLAQKTLGESYISSLVLALLIKFININILYAIFFKLRQGKESLIIAIGFAFSTPFIYNASYFYSDIFLCISCLFIVLAEHKLQSTKDQKNQTLVKVYFCFAAFFIGLNILGVRQSIGILSVILTLISVSVITIRNSKKYLKILLVPWVVGLLIGIAAPIIFFVFNNALPQAIQQILLDAGEKKGVSSLFNILDALTGGLHGSNIYQDFSILKVTACYVLSFIIVGILLFLLFSRNSFIKSKLGFINSQEIGLIFLLTCFMTGIAINEFYRSSEIYGMGIRTFGDILSYDVPRIFFTILFFLSLFFGNIFKTYIGLPDLSFILIFALVLSNVWSLQLSWPGRGYLSIGYDLFNFTIAFLVMTIMLSSSKIKNVSKNRFSLIFFLINFVIFIGLMFSQDFQVQNYDGIFREGPYRDNRFVLNHSIASSIKVSYYKSIVFDKLKKEIKPNDSCFVYGTAQLLYTLLDCKNPTLLDNMFYDNYTLKNSKVAIYSLELNPPKWIIENVGRDPVSIDKVFDGSPRFYGLFSQVAPKVVHIGLRKLIKDYHLVFTARELFPDGKNIKTQDSDDILDFVLYKHK